MNVKLTKKDVIWSYIGTVISMGCNFLMLPIIIYYLDSNMLGLWYVFLSIGAITALFDFGFSLTFSRNITYCWSGAKSLKKESVEFAQNGNTNFLLMKKVLLACKSIYWELSITALLLLLSIGSLYIIYISKEIQGYEHIIAWIIYSIAVFLNLYYGYYALFLRGVGAISQANKNIVISRLVQIVTTVVLLMVGCGIVGVCIAYLFYGTLFRFLGKHMFYRYKDIGKYLRKINLELTKKEIKDIVTIIWHNAWRDGLISLTNYITNQSTVLICSIYLTLTETGVYSIGVQMAMAISAISSTIYMASQPQLQSAYLKNDKVLVKRTMSVIITSFIYIFIIGVLFTVVLGIPFLKFIRSEFSLPISVFLGLCLYHFILRYRDIFSSYYSSTNRIIYMRSFIISAILCLILSFIFTGALRMGVWGLILAQILSQLFYNAWHWPIIAHKEMAITVQEVLSIGNIFLYSSLSTVFKRIFRL